MTPKQAALEIEWIVADEVQKINRRVISRSISAHNLIRSAYLKVLGKDGEGRKYKRGKKKIHIASLPGEPPAPDYGELRKNWHHQTLIRPSGYGNGIRLILRSRSKMEYQKYLEDGTSKMAARPHVEKIREKAQPAIEELFANV